MNNSKEEIQKFINSDKKGLSFSSSTSQINFLTTKIENMRFNEEMPGNLFQEFYSSIKASEFEYTLKIIAHPNFDVKQTVKVANDNSDDDLNDPLETFLHIALSFDQPTDSLTNEWFETNLNAIVLALLKKGADVNAQDSYGYTPLHHAVNGNLTKIVSTLLNASADQTIYDKNNMRPLELAACHGLQEIVTTLLAHNPDLVIPKSTIEMARGCAEITMELAMYLQNQNEKKDQVIINLNTLITTIKNELNSPNNKETMTSEESQYRL